MAHSPNFPYDCREDEYDDELHCDDDDAADDDGDEFAAAAMVAVADDAIDDEVHLRPQKCQ